ncbi:UNVERIFIED_CONTAM: hypothetical protein Slati_1156300 [Sesamum latifolium]|uniref:Uncharacterized protein n=1 Tax=Sesamum latifolium TaxID=2727402 RepID=A0AAW2XC70_9LAMI
MQSAMASSDESVRFMGESFPGEDASEATSRRAGSQSAGPRVVGGGACVRWRPLFAD